MVIIKIKELLEKKHKTKYWLIKNLEGSYQSISRLINNETTSIRFDTIDKICSLLNCKVGDIIEYVEDDE